MSHSPNGTATESSCETLLGVAASGVLIPGRAAEKFV